ncbi:hypothetical protein SAMN04489859_100262 [Paracoccus alcaliphilus]|uniref:DUF6484 domain-containing protein n=1 Tax=Paracoccus alcaliphilus TaxID=34002 RepID=A0A1H8EG60_9RHOB|nr:DUF6484 domain-containing protein [Paracoccus alcaliphilus]WCR20945.1 hypothetical protein JHW40_22255 [Paracoccus alcaliphilus]SEN18485.1 hypothetical protein SAMN04489859_100262 [Paracoccus alcaliphilus]
MDVKDRLNGVVIGLLLGFRDGAPLVVFPSNAEDHAIPARSLTPLSFGDAGAEVALLFEDGDLSRPLIIGRIVELAHRDAPETPQVLRDGETVKITAGQRIELRVGKSAIIMDKDGRITIRGQNLISHASRSNRIRGGSIDLN